MVVRFRPSFERAAGGDPATDARPNAMHVDLEAIHHNVGRLRTALGGGFTFVASLKANAYGFGLATVARTVLSAGVDALAVASVDDAIELRAIAAGRPIILYGGTRPDRRVIGEVVEHDITVTVLDEDDVAAYGAAGTPIRTLLKVDVGLERLGAVPEEAVELARRIAGHPTLVLAGIYTHLHVPRGSVDEVSAYLAWQYARFVAVIDELEAGGVAVPLRMAASSGTLRLSDSMTLDAIDVGSLLYGLEPPGPADRDLGLRPVLVGITSRLTQVRTRLRTEFVDQSPIPTGREVRLGVIPLGAADGLLGLSAGHVLVGGRRAPVLSISLEHARLDLTGIAAKAGDEVVVIGRQGGDEITMREVAAANGLYSPAVVPVLVGRAVPRRYLDGTVGASETAGDSLTGRTAGP
jgi:alanine racemase